MAVARFKSIKFVVLSGGYNCTSREKKMRARRAVSRKRERERERGEKSASFANKIEQFMFIDSSFIKKLNLIQDRADR